MPDKLPFRLVSPWGDTTYLPGLSEALDEMNTAYHKDDALEQWLDGAWVRYDC